MRDINRTRLAAAAKSRRATPDELREARNRIKEIDAELLQLELSPQTKNGEEREQRYERILRLRQMRGEFEARFPKEEARRPNSVVLAMVMTVLSFLTCAFCAGGFYFAYSALTFSPGPDAVASSFWADVKTQAYADAYSNMLSQSLRGQLEQQQFLTDAQAADTDYGPVTKVVLVSQNKNSTQLVYSVTRTKQNAKPITYPVTLLLVSHNNVWGIKDLGAAIYPTLGGVKPAPGSGTPSPGAKPSATP